MTRPTSRLTWAKLNAYGIILAGLAIMAVTDLITPGGADLAKLVGEVPPGQHFWSAGFVTSGLLLLYGFIRGDRLAESLGLGILFVSVLAQTVVAFSLLGWSDFTMTRLAIIAIVGLGGLARVSALWSRDGLVITIPARRTRGE